MNVTHSGGHTVRSPYVLPVETLQTHHRSRLGSVMKEKIEIHSHYTL